jgi:hypothetical protein
VIALQLANNGNPVKRLVDKLNKFWKRHDFVSDSGAISSPYGATGRDTHEEAQDYIESYLIFSFLTSKDHQTPEAANHIIDKLQQRADQVAALLGKPAPKRLFFRNGRPLPPASRNGALRTN